MLGMEERNNYIVRSYKEGKSTVILSKELGINTGTVWYVLKKNNVDIKQKQKFSGNIDDYKSKIIEKYKEGNSAYSISKELNISVPTMCRALNRWGFDLSSNFTVDINNLLKDKFSQVVDLYNKGHSTDDIGRILGHGGSSVWRLLKNNNCLVDRRYEVDEHFFDVIDTEEKAYILGWFYSDGNVSEDRVRISINEDDSYILEKFAKIMKYTGPLYYHDRKKLQHKSLRELCISRVTLVNQLIKLGCVPSKSLILKFPTEDMVPDHLLHHFVRAYFDGDGSVSVRRKTNLNVGFTSTDMFLNRLSEKVLDPLGIYHNMYYRHEGKVTATLFIARKESVKKIYDYLYKDATLFLLRKKQKFEEGLLEEKQ